MATNNLKKECKHCKKVFLVLDKGIERRKSRAFCSTQCARKGQWTDAFKKKVSKTMKSKIKSGEIKRTQNGGDKHHNWKGGLPDCKSCNKKLSIRNNVLGLCRTCYTSGFFGATSPAWKGGITPLNFQLRACVEYKIWRTFIFQRDNYTCQFCKVVGVELHADHIKPFSYILHKNKIKTYEQAISCKDLWDVDNGRTLCKPCHMKTDTWGRGANSKEVKEKLYG